MPDPQGLLWQGIPFVFRLTDTFLATVLPKQINNEIYNELKVYQKTENTVTVVANVLVQKLEVNGSLMEACLGYDEELDLIQIVSGDKMQGAT